eukprot:11636711-Alexandrium_andersonii.AAC.1
MGKLESARAVRLGAPPRRATAPHGLALAAGERQRPLAPAPSQVGAGRPPPLRRNQAPSAGRPGKHDCVGPA